MDRENFIQSSVRIRHAEKKLLTKQQLQRLADAKNLEDAIKLLNETSYSSELSKLDRPENYEQVLSEVLNKTYKEAMEISPEKSLVEILSCKYDYHNLKVLVKENILKEKFDSMYCMLDGNEIEAFRELALKNDEGLSKDFKECLDFFETTKDPQDIDIFIDKKYFEKVLSLAEEFKLEMITEYFKAMIDFINLRTFIRCRKQNQVKETLEKAKTALATAKKNNAEQSIQDGLQDAVTRLEAAVASAKTAADEAQAKFDKVNEVVKAYKDAIDELTDDYNATLGYIENLKEVPKGEEPKDFSGGVNPSDAPSDDAKQPDEVPTTPNAPEFSGGVNPSDSPSGDNGSDFNGGVNDATPPTVPNAPEFTGGVNPADAPVAEEKPEFTGGVNAVEAAVNEVPEFKGAVNDDNAPTQPTNPEFNGGVNDTTPPTVPGKPDGEAPKPSKPEASNGDALVQPELPEFKGGVNAVEAAVNEVPEFDLTKLGTAQPSTPGVDFGQKAPEVKEPAKVKAKNEKLLPNTGMNTSSTTALGLSLIGLIGLAVRRKLSK